MFLAGVLIIMAVFAWRNHVAKSGVNGEFLFRADSGENIYRIWQGDDAIFVFRGQTKNRICERGFLKDSCYLTNHYYEEGGCLVVHYPEKDIHLCGDTYKESARDIAFARLRENGY